MLDTVGLLAGGTAVVLVGELVRRAALGRRLDKELRAAKEIGR